MIRKGHVVTIYEDPLTETKPEGKAELIKLIGEYDSLEEWEIRFCDDNFECSRFIKRLPTEQESEEELRNKVRQFTEKLKERK